MASGKMATETREIHGFERVILQDYGELEIVSGDKESLTIETDAEFLDKIKTNVENGALKIGIGATWLEKLQHAFSTSFTRSSIKYRLVAKHLSGIEIRGASRVTAKELGTENLALKIGGAGEMTVDNLTADRLKVEIQGAGKISLAGQAQSQEIAISGAGQYEGPELASEKTEIVISGSGKATLRASEQLEVILSGVGSIDYYGKAEVRRTISGVGRVNYLGE